MLSQPTPSQFIKLLTQFYIELPPKNSIQNIAYQIRSFVLKRSDLLPKQLIAKKLLDYFLLLQSKTPLQSKQQLNSPFHLSVQQSNAILTIYNFYHLHEYRYAFNLLKQFNTNCSHQISHSISTYNPIYDDIQIQQQTRLKTQYFNKWCQYITHLKIFTQLKQQQHDNKKLSQNFCTYNLQFHYFITWKKASHKTKALKTKIIAIQQNHSNKLLHTHFQSIKNIIHLIQFQKQLVTKISHKIITFKKKSVFKKFQLNILLLKKYIKNCKINTACTFLFLQNFICKFKPLMNRSYQHARSKLFQLMQLQLIFKVFNALKNICQSTKNKTKTVSSHRIFNLFTSWISNFHNKINFHNKTNKLFLQLNSRRKRTVIAIFHSTNSANIQTSELTTNQISLPVKSLTNINIKKLLQQKTKKLIKNSIKKQQQKLFTKLKNLHNITQQNQYHQTKITKICLLRLKLKITQLKQSQQKKHKFYLHLTQKYHTTISKACFKKWRKLKFYHRYQQQQLNSIHKYSIKLTLLLFWNKFKSRIYLKSSLIQLLTSVNYIIIKNTFILIAGYSYAINKQIASIKSKKNKKIVAYLFSLLLKNQSYNTNLSKGIFQFKAKIAKKRIISALKNAHQAQHQLRDIQSKLQISQIKCFFSRLQTFNHTAKANKHYKQKLRKKLFLKSFQAYFQSRTYLNSSSQQSTKKLQKKLTQFSMHKLLTRLKQNKTKQFSFKLKQSKIKNKFIYINIIKFKSQINVIYHTIQLSNNIQSIMNNKVINNLKILIQQQKIHRFLNILKHQLFASSFKYFQKLSLISKNIQHKYLQIKTLLNKKNTKQFYRFLRTDHQQFNDKYNKVSQLSQNNLKQNTKLLFILIKTCKDIKQNTKKLIHHKHQVYLSQLITINLKLKLSKIKYSASLKSYAKTLLKKSFKSLKQYIIKTKQKQNLIKLDKTSSILIQKSIQKSFKSNTLSQQIQRFNLRKSRQIK